MTAGCLSLLTSCSDQASPPQTTLETGESSPTFSEARRGFQTRLLKKKKESILPATPPARIFQLTKYDSPAGKLSAYVSRAPDDGGKHPAVIWLVGGFGSSISELAWETMPRENDQSGAIFRKAGLLMMYPSLRGGNDNPGHKEAFFGEVDDVIAAAKHLQTLPYVDPARIYLGGHSTGGTLALLAGAASDNLFRAVFSLGPIDDPAAYGQDRLPYDITDKMEAGLRAPIVWLDSMRVPTFAFEGNDGNVAALLKLKEANKNPLVSFYPVIGADHFDVIAPVSELLAAKILADTDPERPIAITPTEIGKRISARLPPPRSPFSAGNPRDDRIVFEYAVYLTGPAQKDATLKQVRQLIADEFSELTVAGMEAAPGDRQEVLAQFIDDVPKTYAPPSGEGLRYNGKGLSKTNGEQLQKSAHGVRFWFRHPARLAFEGLRSADRLTARVAELMKGFPWDEQTRQVFSVDFWTRKRITEWTEQFPAAPSHFTIHAYRNGENIRAITLGMEKFGLPDVVIDQFSWSDNRSMGNLINCFCQALIEGAALDDPDDFELDLRQLKNAKIRQANLETLAGGGTGRIRLALKRAAWEEGDPPNRIVEITPDHHPGPDMFAMQTAMLDTLFGSSDEIKMVKHSAADLQAASQRARQKLPGLKKEFAAGLAPGEFILIKAPFEVPTGGQEWMWVEIAKWDGDTLDGMLRSEPRGIPALKAGQQVTVSPAKIFDYIRRLPDGTSEGNETGKIIEAMRQR
jgi:dienelactone hydrolase